MKIRPSDKRSHGRIWGGQAPRLPIAAPRRNSLTSKVRDGDGAIASRRGACAPQNCDLSVVSNNNVRLIARLRPGMRRYRAALDGPSVRINFTKSRQTQV